MKRFFTQLFFLFLFTFSAIAQTGLVQGSVADAETGEKILACYVMLQGTKYGSVTDMDGNYKINNVPPGTYNLTCSFISYEKQIVKVMVGKGANVKVDIKLKPATTSMKEVEVKATRLKNTDLAMIEQTRLGLTISSGISSQQISRTQDRDASEVIRRVPGVSIRDGKFVIVRGLTERYNSVWLNSSTTPSSESDVRAFSFDVIPSGQIDNILIYKSPAPELPADFAGAMINIKTKSIIDQNSFSFSYSYGFHQGTTGENFNSYKGGKTDWLGYDDGTRNYPGTVPSTAEYKDLFNQVNASKIDQINSISKSFNTNMTPNKKTAAPDADFQLSLNRRFKAGNVTIGSITALGYNSTNTYENSFRAAYWAYPDTSYRFVQHSYTSKVRFTALSNWAFIFGDHNKIELRNIFNNYGMTKTLLKEGLDFYTYSNERSYELGYESRTTYSGQLAGNHSFNSDKIKLDWVLGGSYANKNQPDLRRIKTTAYDLESGTQYMINLSTQGAADAFGRMFLKNNESILNGALNYSHKLNLGGFRPEVKAGGLYEYKKRDFSSRVFVYAKSGSSSMYYIPVESYNGGPAFDDAMFSSINDVLNTKIDYKTGINIAEVTQAADSYNANNELIAGYLACNLPITKWFNTYLGVRVEKNKLTLNGFKRDGTDKNPIHVNIDSVDIFPSINTSLNITDKLLFRLAGGKTVNRPEFREVSPFVFYSFEDNAMTFGNPEVVNCYVTNSDARIEWYPTAEEIVSIGAFYKDFKNPIESKILYTGSGWNYTYKNADKAKSYGLEIDIRKRLHELEHAGIFRFLSNLTFVMNASLIKSIVKTDSITEGTKERVLQGQSPYILNLGAYYQDKKARLMASVMYNKTGERIAIVGDIIVPHIYEMPFNSLDFTFEKGITKWLNMKFGVKNLLDDDVVFQQNQKYKLNGESKSRIQVTNKFKPGRQFKLGLSMNF